MSKDPGNFLSSAGPEDTLTPVNGEDDGTFVEGTQTETQKETGAGSEHGELVVPPAPSVGTDQSDLEHASRGGPALAPSLTSLPQPIPHKKSQQKQIVTWKRTESISSNSPTGPTSPTFSTFSTSPTKMRRPELENELRHYRRKSKEWSAEKKQLKQDKAMGERNVDILCAQLAKKDVEIQSLRKQLDEKDEELRRVTDRAQTLQWQLDDAKNEEGGKKYLALYQDARDEIEKLKGEKERLKETIAEQEGEKEQLEETIAEQEGEKERLKETIAEQEGEKERLKETIAEQNKEKEQLGKIITKLEFICRMNSLLLSEDSLEEANKRLTDPPVCPVCDKANGECKKCGKFAESHAKGSTEYHEFEPVIIDKSTHALSKGILRDFYGNDKKTHVAIESSDKIPKFLTWTLLCKDCNCATSPLEGNFLERHSDGYYYRSQPGVIHAEDAKLLHIFLWQGMAVSVPLQHYKLHCDECRRYYTRIRDYLRGRRSLLKMLWERFNEQDSGKHPPLSEVVPDEDVLPHKEDLLFHFEKDPSNYKNHCMQFPIIVVIDLSDLPVGMGKEAFIYAQLPPTEECKGGAYYWAAPLALEQDQLAKLQPYFPKIVDAVNGKLSDLLKQYCELYKDVLDCKLRPYLKKHNPPVGYIGYLQCFRSCPTVHVTI